MSASAATAPARKGPAGQESEFRRLAREMESTKGLDPIPPDQYLYFLGKKESPLQRLLALVRASTIQRGRRSAHCVDEHGKPMTLADLERTLEMDHGNFKRVVREATARGLIRVGGRDETTHRAQRTRVYLCGTVAESRGYEEGEEKGGVCTDPLRFLSPAQRKTYEGWRKEQQERFYAAFDSAVNYKLQVEREAIALARHIGDRALDQVFSAHDLPKTRLATSPPESKLLQLTLVSAVDGSVQTPSVPTPLGGSAHTAIRESVPKGASLLPSESREVPLSVSRSLAATAAKDDRPTDAGRLESEIKATLQKEWGKLLPLDAPTPRLLRNIAAGLRGAPVAQLAERMRQRRSSATGYGFAVVLANDVGIAWMESAEDRAKAAAASERHAATNREEAVFLCQETLNDPRASEEEKQLAREVLKAAAAGGAS